MMTKDVNGLYNNIDHEEGANACYIALEERKRKKISSDTSKSMILFILKNNVFRFSNSIFKQVTRVAMGIPLAPNLANLFMTEVETRMLHEYEAKTGLRPMLWLRYIDDIFFLWPYREESMLEFIDFVRHTQRLKVWNLY